MNYHQYQDDGSENPSSDDLTFDYHSVSEGMTEEEAMQIWLRRDQEIEDRLQMERQMQRELLKNNPDGPPSDQDPLGELPQGQPESSSSSSQQQQQSRSPSPTGSGESSSSAWRAALASNPIDANDPTQQGAYLAYERFINLNRPGVADAYVPSTPGLALLLEQQRRRDAAAAVLAEGRRRQEEMLLEAQRQREEQLLAAQRRQQQQLWEAQQRAVFEANQQQQQQQQQQGYGGYNNYNPRRYNDTTPTTMGGGAHHPQDQAQDAYLAAQANIMMGGVGGGGPQDHQSSRSNNDPGGIEAQVQEYERLAQAHRAQAAHQARNIGNNNNSNRRSSSSRSNRSSGRPPSSITAPIINVDNNSSNNPNTPSNNNNNNSSNNSVTSSLASSISTEKKKDPNSFYVATPNRTEFHTIPVMCLHCRMDLFTHPLAQNFFCQNCCKITMIGRSEVEEIMGIAEDGTKYSNGSGGGCGSSGWDEKMMDRGDYSEDVDMMSH